MDASLAHSLRAYLGERQGAMLDLLRTLVEAESPSDVPEAQSDVQRLLVSQLGAIGYAVRRLPGGGRSGGHLFACPRERRHGRPLQLLLGHSDTVWPLGTLAEMPFEVRENQVRGPGAYDMKGGLVQMCFALEALGALGCTLPVTPLVFINSDEEIGSRESTRYIQMLARRADRAFVLEPGLGLEGRLKTQRKGAGRFTIRVKGTSAHAGLAPSAGASAIVELSYVIQKLHALNDPEAGTSVNVGLIDGGVRSNVVAAESSAVADVRVASADAAEEVARAIQSLTPVTPGTRLVVEGGMGRLPMAATPRNRRLWQAAREAATLLGLVLEEGTAGGVSDGNTASLFTATLDGLGAVGDGAHARHEFLYADKMPERSALLALLLMMPPVAVPFHEDSARQNAFLAEEVVR